MVKVKLREDWLMRRGRVNHDCLQNDIIMALNAFFQEIEDNGFESDITGIRSALDSWGKLRGEAERLVSNFQQHMSPRNLFDSSPLDQCSDETKEWLGDVVHLLWFSQHKETASKTLETLLLTDAASVEVGELVSAWERGDITDLWQAGRERFSNFRECCDNLSDSIAEFQVSIL